MYRKHPCCVVVDVTYLRDDKPWRKWVTYSFSPCLDMFISLPMDDFSIAGMDILLNASLCSFLVSRGMLIYDFSLFFLIGYRID